MLRRIWIGTVNYSELQGEGEVNGVGDAVGDGGVVCVVEWQDWT